MKEDRVCRMDLESFFRAMCVLGAEGGWGWGCVRTKNHEAKRKCDRARKKVFNYVAS